MRQVNLFDLIAGEELKQLATPAELVQAIIDSDCTRCRRADFRTANEGQRITVFRGNLTSKIWVMGKSPGVQDGLIGLPYSHGSGDMLGRMLQVAGLDWQKDCFLTNPVFCAALDDKTPTAGEINQCAFHIDQLVQRLQPKVFISLGSTGYRALTGEDKAMSELGGKTEPFQSRFGIPVWVVYHPAYFFKVLGDVEEAKRKSFLTLKAMKLWLKSL